MRKILNNKSLKAVSIFTLGCLLLVIGLAVSVSAYSGGTPSIVIENFQGFIKADSGGDSEDNQGSLGALNEAITPSLVDADERTNWNDGYFDDLETQDDLYVGNDLTVIGDSTLAGGTLTSLTVSGDSTLATTTLREPATTLTSTTTLTVAQSGTTFYIDVATGTTITLPVATSSAGVVYKFVIADTFVNADVVITSAEGDNIEGSIIVAGAVVDCDAADSLTFVNDGENIGDFVELRSNGDKWFPGASGALTSAKLTCSG